MRLLRRIWVWLDDRDYRDERERMYVSVMHSLR